MTDTGFRVERESDRQMESKRQIDGERERDR